MTEQYFVAALLVGGFLFLWVKLREIQAELRRMDSQAKFASARQLEEIKTLLAQQIPAGDVEVKFAIHSRDGQPVASSEISICSEELTTVQVANWLERRDLTMQPKGLDFKFKAPVSNPKT